MTSNKSTLPSDSWTGGAAGREHDDSDDLKAVIHGLDVTVWLLIFSIFTFFFILVTATLCMHWLAQRRTGLREVVIVPTGPVPGFISVAVLPGTPHIRLLAHYHSHLNRKHGSISELPLISAPRTLSTPELYNPCCRPAHVKK